MSIGDDCLNLHDRVNDVLVTEHDHISHCRLSQVAFDHHYAAGTEQKSGELLRQFLGRLGITLRALGDKVDKVGKELCRLVVR